MRDKDERRNPPPFEYQHYYDYETVNSPIQVTVTFGIFDKNEVHTESYPSNFHEVVVHTK